MVGISFTTILPFIVNGPQLLGPDMVVKLNGYVPGVKGVPVIVIVPPVESETTEPKTPGGSPLKVAPCAPSKVY